MTGICKYCNRPALNSSGRCERHDGTYRPKQRQSLIDKDVPRSRLLFEGYGYTVSIAGFDAKNGPFLVVARKTKDGTRGRCLQGRAAVRWAEHIETAMDDKECQMLCSAIYRS